jgi:hypothetical protein
MNQQQLSAGLGPTSTGTISALSCVRHRLLKGSRRVVFSLMAALAVAAADSAGAAEPPQDGSAASTFFTDWSRRVEEARSSQPHWHPPLMTLTPLMTQLLREDMYYQWAGNGSQVLNVGGNKGLFLVPAKTVEVDIGIPTFQQRYGAQPAAGLLDWQFLQVKQRLFSANKENGNYIATAALAAQVPSGTSAFTNHAVVLTPALLGGKGFGDLNIQMASSLAIPTTNGATLGTSWLNNVAFQYQLGQIFWPEFEVNWTHWLGGNQRGGLDQLFFTVGTLVGPIPLSHGTAVVIGAGYQFAVAPPKRFQPSLTPVYQNALIISARLIF